MIALHANWLFRRSISGPNNIQRGSRKSDSKAAPKVECYAETVVFLNIPIKENRSKLAV